MTYTKTYTIATLNGVLIATVPYGQDVFQAAAEEAERAGIEIEFGDLDVTECVLADEEEDGDKVVFRAGPHTGYLMDEEGRRYDVAVIRKARCTIMDRQQLEALRHKLSVLVSDLSRQSMDADDAGDRVRADELWERMREAREELRRVDAVIDRQVKR